MKKLLLLLPLLLVLAFTRSATADVATNYEPGSWLYSHPGAVESAQTAALHSFTSSAWKRLPAYPLLNGLGSNKWGMVHADGAASDPVWHLTGTIPKPVQNELGVNGPGFHAPAWLGSVLTLTSDSPFEVDDHATGISVWAAKASKGSGYTIKVGSAGYFVHGTNGVDQRAPGSDGPHNYVSRGRIPDTMVITASQVANAEAGSGDLGHVLEMFWNETDSSAGHLYPMVGQEAGHTGWGAEGQRIALTANPVCSNPVAQVIGTTLYRYGAYLGDNAGNATALKMEQENSAHPVWNGSVSQKSLGTCTVNGHPLTWLDFEATQ